MIEYILQGEQSKDNIPDDQDDWYIQEVDYTFKLWIKRRAYDYQHLPFAGGLADQPDGLMDDLSTLDWLHEVIKAHHEANKGLMALTPSN